jgi:hypothetical protein
MPMTKIEEYIFGRNPVAHIVRSFNSEGGVVTMILAPLENHAKPSSRDTTVTFSGAVTPSVWQDPDESPEWPLDLIGFDCYPLGTRWRFVLNCDTIEWTWESEWPVVSRDFDSDKNDPRISKI